MDISRNEGMKLTTYEEHLEQIINKYPNDVQSKMALGVTYAEKGNYKECLPLFSKSLRRLPGFPITLVKVNDRTRTHATFVQSQIKIFEEIQRDVPFEENPYAVKQMLSLAYYYYLQSEYKLAEKQFLTEVADSILKIGSGDPLAQPDMLKIYQGYSCIFREMGNKQGATNALIFALEFGGHGYYGCTARICEGAIHLKENRIRPAIRSFQRAKDEYEEEPWSWLSLAIAFLMVKQWQDAIDTFEVVLDLEKNPPRYHRYWAWAGIAIAYYRLKEKSNLESAIQIILDSDLGKLVDADRDHFHKQQND